MKHPRPPASVNMIATSDLPPSFVLRNICEITGSVFELKQNFNQDIARNTIVQWFASFKVYDEAKAQKWLEYGRFDTFAALSFPDADLSHLETCLAFFLWAFSTDDLSDEGELQCKPDDVKSGHAASYMILHDANAPQPDYPYAAMLWDLLRRIRSTASAGTVNRHVSLSRSMWKFCLLSDSRFIQAFLDWSESQVQQAANRNVDRMPPVEEFILMRRCTIGAALVEAMVEYSLDIELPDYVFQDPIFIGMSHAMADIMTWPNDLCSFNKEQADGDYQNLVCVLQHAYDLDLQGAVDMLTDMIRDRVQDYTDLKKRLPSFGSKVDTAVRRYHEAMENFTQGCVVWYYSSPRYFRNTNPLGKDMVVIELFPRNYGAQ
ncbi:hypothetical protein VNI00_002924 [Paramarasmius palmivorus]|uniref:Terpene synthase n=1 Tax=Paramarasmius palmivorus TaxID=297713 RepID=A0AAW0DXB9_9AGAR